MTSQDSSELFHRGGGRSELPGQHASAGPLHLPLSGLLFRPQRCGSGRRGPLLQQVGDTKHTSLEDTKPARQLGPLPGHTVQKPFQHEWSKTADAMEATVVMEKNLNRAMLDLHALSSACADSQLSDFLESHFRG
ncbi:hypothetical protein EI555_007278 [Monodon monoceros]|uniref:Ferritin light chain n=1 Tax=Monodon monoceros TaxID=40151 RepID=A0A4U1F519_MONMO|nr:hypothetical protein EI555_007278 [Monodon monoceros]